jgi:L-alanine-DL-glutamate epimerase-like enolase superfamily enzyme
VKITGFEVFPVVCPPPFRGGRSWLFVRLDTDSETSGYGEMMLLGTGFRLPVLAVMVGDIIEQAVIGKDYGQPVYRLLGGQMRDRVRTYTYTYTYIYIYDDPSASPSSSSGASPSSSRPLSRDVWLNPAHAAARAGTTSISASPRSRSTRSRWS